MTLDTAPGERSPSRSLPPMAHDLVIRSGTVVDGTGAPARTADVAIDGDRITQVGRVTDSGAREIDADGLLVTPGFVDIHTHYDAQIGWDPLATSSCWHGVTSIVMGNCGMTFAPCRPADREQLARTMESVEDIPAEAILDGLPWDWETYDQYLESLDRTAKGVNVGGMVGHSALRYWAMGDASLDPEAAPSDAQLGEMAELLRAGMAAGALGFSTSRTLRHTAPDGRNVPGTFADERELGALGQVLADLGRGVIELAPRFDGEGPSEPRCRSELAWMRDLSIATGRPITFNLTHTFANPEHHLLAIELAKDANGAGAQIRPQTTSRGIGVLFALGGSTPFDRHPSWRALHDIPAADRARELVARREQLLAEAAEGPDGEQLARFFLTGVDSSTARFDCDPATELPAVAAAAGVTAAEAYLDALIRSDGAAVVYWPILNQDLAAVGEMLADDTVVLGLADGGAHVGQILDASQPTWFLTYWVRERGHVPLERAIQRLTADGAELFGLDGRGRLEAGCFADVNLIDLDRLTLGLPHIQRDFPHGAARFVQRADGYVATVVNGAVALEHGEHTGALTGRVLRSA